MVWCKSRLSFCRSFLKQKNIYTLAAWEGNNTFLQRCFPQFKGEGHLDHPHRNLQTLCTQRHFNLFLTTEPASSACPEPGISLYSQKLQGSVGIRRSGCKGTRNTWDLKESPKPSEQGGFGAQQITKASNQKKPSPTPKQELICFHQISLIL